MAVINYTAKRNVTGGRTVGNSYNVTINLTRQDRRPKRQTNEAVSLNGTTFTTFHRLEIFYDCQSAPENDSSTLDQIREFLDSCAGGETFSISGTNYQLDGDYSESLVELSGFYTFSFRMRKL